MNKFISFSGGVESTTMCILYGKDAKAIFCDTGSEHSVMYDRISFVEQQIKLIHPNFEIIRIIPQVISHKKTTKVLCNTVEEYAIDNKFMPSGQARWCTSEFKIKPIDLFLSQYEQCELMIGLNFDEQERLGNKELMTNVKYTYPLIDDGYTRKECEDILNIYNLHPEFPAYMSRGGCRMCFFKSKKEYIALYYLNRKEFYEVAEFEQKIQDKRLKFYSILSNGKSLKQIGKELENSIFSYEDNASFYSKQQNETSCGLFCHR